jgi:hypothetical protein
MKSRMPMSLLQGGENRNSGIRVIIRQRLLNQVPSGIPDEDGHSEN